MWQYFKRVSKDSLIYGLSSVLGRFAGLLILPFLTRVFTPDNYGVLELLSTAGGFFSCLVMLSMNASLVAFFHDHEAARKKAIVASNFLFTVVWGILLLLLSIAFGRRLFPLLFGIEVPYHWVVIVLVAGFLVPVKENFLSLLRLLFRPWSYFATSLLSLIVSIVLIVVLVFYFKQGISGYLLAGAAAAMLSIIVSLLLTHQWFKGRPSLSLTKKMLAFGIPLLPADFAIWGIQYVERISVLHWLSAHDLGIFAVGSRVAGVMMVLMFSFRIAWAPFALSIKEKPDAAEFYNLADRGLKAAGALCSVLLLAFSLPVLYLMTPVEYHPSYKVVGFIAYGIFFSSIYWVSGLGVVIAKKSPFLTAAILISAVVALCFYVVLTPLIGIVGASIAGCLGHLAGNVAITYFGEKAKPVGLSVSFTLWVALLAFLFMFAQIYIYEYIGGCATRAVMTCALCIISTVAFTRIGLGQQRFLRVRIRVTKMVKAAV